MIHLVPLFGEVADKEPTLLKFWSVAIVLSAASLLFSLWRRWAVVIPAAISIIWAYAVWSELQDRFVGPAIREELGANYVIQGYATTILPLAVALFAFFWRKDNAA
jgi:hypothetical protein